MELVPDVPPAFSNTIQRATAKDRSDRQTTASVLASELQASVVGTGDLTSSGFAPPQDLPAATVAVGGGSTKSDVTAPTIIEMNPTPTMDRASSTNPPSSPPPAPAAQPAVPPPPTPVASSQGADSKTIASVMTVPRVGVAAGAEVVTPPKKSKAGLFIALAGLLLVGVIGAGIAAVFIFKSSKTEQTVNKNGGSIEAPPVARDVAKYWLELEGKSGSKPTRVAGLVPLASGQSFKMHFVFERDGYVYLIGPGPANQPTAFLTSKPSEATGLENNQTSSGSDLSFPNGATNWLTLDLNPGTENYTVIFSKSPLSAGFLNGAVTGEPLSAQQKDEMNQFLSKYKGTDAKTELDESDREAPFVRIKSTKNADEPIVFDIRIQHN
jgi:hypothetical protein